MARLYTGRQRILSIPCMGKRFLLFSKVSKMTGEDVDQLLALSTELTMVQLYLHSKIRLHGVHRGILLFFDTHYEVIKNFPTRVLKS